MSELISQLGIDWRLLLAQVVNFLLLFWLLKRFAFGPLQKFLAKRQQEIKQGLDDAAKAQQDREELKVLRAQLTAKAQQEAQKIIGEARAKGASDYDSLMKQAEAKVQALATKARAQLIQEKDEMMRQAKGELGQLVMMAAQKLLHEKMDEKKDREIVEKALREIK